MIGKYVICRTYSAGVHAGVLTALREKEVVLVDSRRLWQWKCKKGISLSEVALYGLDPEGSRICSPVSKILLTEAIEIIPTTPDAEKSIREQKNDKCN